MEELKEKINEKLNTMISEISFNTSPGSFARDIISAVAIELSKEEIDYKNKLNSRFIDTATGNDLDIVCNDKNITRKLATYATGNIKITGEKGAKILKGYVVSTDNNKKYEITEDTTIENISKIVNVRSLEAGEVGNCFKGEIKKFIETYDGLSSCENLEDINNGRNIESDEELRTRALNLIQKPRLSWNRYVFEDKAIELGAETAHCIPRDRGAGTVKLIISEKNKETVSTELIKKIKEGIEFEIISDINLVVEGIQEQEISLNLEAIIDENYSSDERTRIITEKLNKFFLENIYKDKLHYFNIVEVIQHSGCIKVIKNLEVNGGRADIELNENKICKLKNLTIN